MLQDIREKASDLVGQVKAIDPRDAQGLAFLGISSVVGMAYLWDVVSHGGKSEFLSRTLPAMTGRDYLSDEQLDNLSYTPMALGGGVLAFLLLRRYSQEIKNREFTRREFLRLPLKISQDVGVALSVTGMATMLHHGLLAVCNNNEQDKVIMMATLAARRKVLVKAMGQTTEQPVDVNIFNPPYPEAQLQAINTTYNNLLKNGALTSENSVWRVTAKANLAVQVVSFGDSALVEQFGLGRDIGLIPVPGKELTDEQLARNALFLQTLDEVTMAAPSEAAFIEAVWRSYALVAHPDDDMMWRGDGVRFQRLESSSSTEISTSFVSARNIVGSYGRTGNQLTMAEKANLSHPREVSTTSDASLSVLNIGLPDRPELKSAKLDIAVTPPYPR